MDIDNFPNLVRSLAAWNQTHTPLIGTSRVFIQEGIAKFIHLPDPQSAHERLAQEEAKQRASQDIAQWWAQACRLVPYLSSPKICMDWTMTTRADFTGHIQPSMASDRSLGFVVGRESISLQPLANVLRALSVFGQGTAQFHGSSGRLWAQDATQAVILDQIYTQQFDFFLAQSRDAEKPNIIVMPNPQSCADLRAKVRKTIPACRQVGQGA